MKITKTLCFIGLWGAAGLVHAVIYKHIDANGRTTYSTSPIKGGKQIATDAEEKQREAKEEAKRAMRAAKHKQKNAEPAPGQISATTPGTPSAGSELPRTVDAATQKMRDTQRGRILASELQTEKALQQDTQKKLANERDLPVPNEERIKQLEEDLQVHHKNINALQKEINRIR